MGRAPLVSGEVVFSEPLHRSGSAVVRVRLLDVTRADADAEVLAEQVIPDVKLEPEGRPRVPFELFGNPQDERRRCIVDVHVDLTGDGEVKVGDWITMASHPVVTRGQPTTVTVRVREVK